MVTQFIIQTKNHISNIKSIKFKKIYYLRQLYYMVRWYVATHQPYQTVHNVNLAPVDCPFYQIFLLIDDFLIMGTSLPIQFDVSVYKMFSQYFKSNNIVRIYIIYIVFIYVIRPYIFKSNINRNTKALLMGKPALSSKYFTCFVFSYIKHS